MKNIAILIAFFAIFNPVKSQITAVTAFEGVIKYAVTMEGKKATDLATSEPCKNMDMFFKDGDYIINLFNGGFPTTRLFIADSNQMFVVDPANQRAFRGDPYDPKTKTPPTAIPTGETKTIAGVVCQGYKVTKPEKTVTYYVSDQYKVNTELFIDKFNADGNFLTKGLNGKIPLMSVIVTKDLKVTTLVTKIEKKKLNTSDFRIPNGWKLLGRDYRR